MAEQYTTSDLMKEMQSQVSDISQLTGEDPRLKSLPEQSQQEQMTINYAMLQKLHGGVHTKCRVRIDESEYIMRLLGVDEKLEIEEEVAQWWESVKYKPKNPIVGEGMQLHMKMLKTLRRAFSSCPENITDGDLITHQELGSALNSKGLGRHAEHYILKLYKSYIELENKYNPEPDKMTLEQIKMAVEGIYAKKILLRTCSFWELENLLSHILGKLDIELLRDKCF